MVVTIERPAAQDPQILKQYSRIWEALQSYEAPFLEEAVIKKGICSDKAEYQMLFTELKRFFFVSHVLGGEPSIFSKLVDDVWHEFILYTRHYREFCESTLGSFVDHYPYSDADVERIKNDREARFQCFKDCYEEFFGQLPMMWYLSRKDLTDEYCCAYC